MAEGKFIISAQNKIAEGLNGAKADLTNFGKDTEKVSKSIFDNFTVTFGDITNVIEGVFSTVGEFFSEFAEQEKAVKTFDAAISQSAQLTDGVAERLKEYAGAMALKTGADDDAILSMASFLATSGRTEDQIRKVIAAAADMSTVTGKDLKTSVEDINKTFAGTEGRMGQIVLGLGSLTKEELAAGKGVDVIAEQYGGLADAMGGSASVALGNLTNTVDDVKAALGESLMPAVQPMLELFVEFLNDPLIPAIKGLAPIVKEVFENVSQFITDMKPAVEPILKWFGDVWTMTIGPNIKSLGNILKETLSIISGIFTGDWSKVWNSAKTIVTDVIDIISRAFQPVVSSVNAVINGIETALQKLGILQAKQKTDTKYVTDKSGKIIGYYDETGKYNKYASGTRGAAPGWALVGEEGPEVVLFNGGEEVIPNHKLGGYAAGTDYGAGGAASFRNNGGGQVQAPTWLDEIGAVFGSLGSTIGPIVSKFVEMLSSLSSVTQILNWGETILAAMFKVIGPMVDELLTPIVGILNVLGAALGDMLVPILEALSPVIVMLSEAFVWLYNEIIIPVGNFMYAWVATIWNGIVFAVNTLLGWLGVRLEYMDTSLAPLHQITMDDVQSAGESTVSASTSAASANYATQSITINIYQQAPIYGAGGWQEFVGDIRDGLDSLMYAGR